MPKKNPAVKIPNRNDRRRCWNTKLVSKINGEKIRRSIYLIEMTAGCFGILIIVSKINAEKILAVNSYLIEMTAGGDGIVN